MSIRHGMEEKPYKKRRQRGIVERLWKPLHVCNSMMYTHTHTHTMHPPDKNRCSLVAENTSGQLYTHPIYSDNLTQAMQPVPLSCHLLDLNLLFSTLTSNTLSLCSSLNVTHQVSQPHNNRKNYTAVYLLTPWSTGFPQKLTSPQPVTKFPASYGTRSFSTSFTTARHLFLS